jgi:hypothetical protein
MVMRSLMSIAPSLLFFGITGITSIADAQSQLTINVNSNNGAILHGASGWLYGQAELDLPSQNLMAPLKPQYSAQKPPQGLQHAGGDVTQVTPPT